MATKKKPVDRKNGLHWPRRATGRARHARKRGFNIPLTERLKIAAAFMQGGPDNTPPKLAKRFGRGVETVYAIIYSPAVQEIGKAMEQKLIETSAEAVADRINYEVKTRKSKAGAWIAMELAERWGAIPPKIKQVLFPQGQPPAIEVVPEEKRVEGWVKKLTEITMERGRIFGMPMPELEEEEAVKEEITIPLKLQGKEQEE